MVKVKNKKNSGLADKVRNKRRADATKKTLNPFEVHVNREKFKVLGRKLKHDRGLPGVSRAKAIQKRKETLGTEFKLMNKSNSFVDRRIGERNSQLSGEDKILARFAAEQARRHSRKDIYNLTDDVLTHRGQTLEEVEKFDDPRSSDEEDDDGRRNGGLNNDFVSEGHFGGGILSKTDTKDGAKSHKDLIEQLIAESKKRKAEKQKLKEQTLDLTEKLDTDWKDLQPIVLKKARVEKEEESLIDRLLNKETKRGEDYDKMMRELRFEKRGTPSDGLQSEEKMAKEQKDKLEQLERDRRERMRGVVKTNINSASANKHRSADDLDDNFEIDEPVYMVSYDSEGRPLLPEHILKEHSLKKKKVQFDEDDSNSEDDKDAEDNDEESEDDTDDESEADSLNDLKDDDEQSKLGSSGKNSDNGQENDKDSDNESKENMETSKNTVETNKRKSTNKNTVGIDIIENDKSTKITQEIITSPKKRKNSNEVDSSSKTQSKTADENDDIYDKSTSPKKRNNSKEVDSPSKTQSKTADENDKITSPKKRKNSNEVDSPSKAHCKTADNNDKITSPKKRKNSNEVDSRSKAQCKTADNNDKITSPKKRKNSNEVDSPSKSQCKTADNNDKSNSPKKRKNSNEVDSSSKKQYKTGDRNIEIDDKSTIIITEQLSKAPSFNFIKPRTDLMESKPEKILFNSEDVDEQISNRVKADLLARKVIMEKAKKELPYTFDMPGEYEELEGLLSKHQPEYQSVILERLIKCYHPSLAENNKELLRKLFAYLLQYVNDIFSNLKTESQIVKSFQIFDKISPQIYDLAQLNVMNAKQCLTEVIVEKYEDFKKDAKTVPALDTLIFFKLVSLIFPTSDFRHPVVTPCRIFMSEILTKCKYASGYSIARGLFVTALILEYTVLSKRFVPSAISFVRGVIYLSANTSVLNPIQVVPPFKLFSKEARMLVVNEDCSKMEVKTKMVAKDLIRKDVTADFKVRCLSSSVNMLKEMFTNCNDLETQECMFEPHIRLLGRVDLDLYPEEVAKNVSDTVTYMKETLEMKTYTPLAREKKRPRALKLYEPDVQDVFTGSKSSKLTREQADRDKLKHKLKRETKGALREIRRDKAYLGGVKIKQKIQSDNIRKSKVRQIYKDASMQQGELNKLKRQK